MLPFNLRLRPSLPRLVPFPRRPPGGSPACQSVGDVRLLSISTAVARRIRLVHTALSQWRWWLLQLLFCSGKPGRSLSPGVRNSGGGVGFVFLSVDA
uniref:Uncharacterized protein n=1 Tax=Arundo donax TaxID=35708 RepID=A0A0A9CYP4_ARUDO